MLSFVIKRFIKAGRKKTPSGCTLLRIQPDGAFAISLLAGFVFQLPLCNLLSIQSS